MTNCYQPCHIEVFVAEATSGLRKITGKLLELVEELRMRNNLSTATSVSESHHPSHL